MKNFKNLAIILLLVCVVTCTVSSVCAVSKILEEEDTSIDLDDDVPLLVPTDLVEDKVIKKVVVERGSSVNVGGIAGNANDRPPDRADKLTYTVDDKDILNIML